MSKITIDRSALESVRVALEHAADWLYESSARADVDAAIETITAALEQPTAEPAEPVAWAISYDGVTPYSLFDGGDGPLLDLEVRRLGGTACKLPLYAAPRPVERAPAAEPVATITVDRSGNRPRVSHGVTSIARLPDGIHQLYAAPPHGAPQHPLSDEQIGDLIEANDAPWFDCENQMCCGSIPTAGIIVIARAVERAHGIGGQA